MLIELIIIYLAITVACTFGLCLLAINGEIDIRREWWLSLAWPYLCWLGWLAIYRDFIKGK